MQRQLEELATLKVRYSSDSMETWLTKLGTLNDAMQVVLEDTGLSAAYWTLFNDVREARMKDDIDAVIKTVNALMQQMKGDIKEIEEHAQAAVSTTRKVFIGTALGYLGYRIFKHLRHEQRIRRAPKANRGRMR